MNPNKKISVITPCYNDADTLKLHIETFLDQDYPDKELVLVDDGSKDNSKKIIREFVGKNNGLIKAIYFPQNRGACTARNEGAKIATGEIYSFLPADSFLKPGLLRRWVEYFEQYPDVDFFYGGYAFVDSSIGLPTWHGGRLTSNFLSEPYDSSMLESYNYIDGSFPLKAKTFWAAAKKVGLQDGLWNPSIKSLQDWDFWLSVVKDYGGHGMFTPGIYFETTMPHKGGLSDDSNTNWLARVKQIQAAHNIRHRELCVSSLMSEFHGRSVAKILDSDFRVMPAFKQHDFKAIYQIGFLPTAFLHSKSVFGKPGFVPSTQEIEDGTATISFPLFHGKRFIHFIGSDVLALSKIPMDQLIGIRDFINSCDGVFAEIPQIQKELKSFGIKSDVVPFPPRRWFDVRPLPEQKAVAVYMPQRNEDFYFRGVFLGGDGKPGLIHKMKDVHFYFFGNPLDRKHPMKNVHFMGRVADVDDIIEKTRVIVRIVPHDGLPISVAEFIGAGRNALTTVKLPYADHFDIPGFYKRYGKSFKMEIFLKELEKSIRQTLDKPLNSKGAAHYRKWLDADKYRKTIASYMNYDEKRYWEHRANEWDEQSKKEQVQRKKLKKFVDGLAFKTVLDIGCGSGRFVELFKGKDYQGCDISEKLVEIAQSRHPDSKFFVSSLENLDKHMGYRVDLLFSYTCLEHIKPENMSLAVASMKRCARQALLIEPVDFVPDGDYCFNHDYKKLFNVVKEVNLGNKKMMLVSL